MAKETKKPEKQFEGVRLQKYLAECGVASRRKSEQLIVDGFVSVNGKVVKVLGTKVQPGVDEVKVYDEKVSAPRKKQYVLFNKPKGYLVSRFDPHNPKTIYSLLPNSMQSLFPVGRLDKNSEGLLILTNDGELANMLTHPKFHIEKEYLVTIKGVPAREDTDKLRKGVMIEGKKTSPAEINFLTTKENKTELRIVLHEGRKRQIRLMFESIGYLVTSLKRVRIGHIRLANMKNGTTRYLSDEEIKSLKKLVAEQGLEPRTLRI